MQINPLAFPVFVIAAVLFWMGKLIAGRTRSKAARVCVFIFGCLIALPGLTYVFYYLHLFDQAIWFYNFRALRFTELLAGGMGLLFGTLHAWMDPDTYGEKLVLPIALFVLLFIPFMKPVLSPIDLDSLKADCPGDVCLQSTESSCGPASAATILRSFGMAASERDLAHDAYTYRGGTENWYLTRALRNRGVDAHVENESLNSEIPAPAIAGVILPGGAGHFIAVLASEGNNITIADPLLGKFEIPKSQLTRRYHFTGFFLVVSRKAR